MSVSGLRLSEWHSVWELGILTWCGLQGRSIPTRPVQVGLGALCGFKPFLLFLKFWLELQNCAEFDTNSFLCWQHMMYGVVELMCQLLWCLSGPWVFHRATAGRKLTYGIKWGPWVREARDAKLCMLCLCFIATLCLSLELLRAIQQSLYAVS